MPRLSVRSEIWGTDQALMGIISSVGRIFMESRTHTDTLLFRGADLSLASNKHHRSNGKSNGATVFSEWLADLKLPGESPIGS